MSSVADFIRIPQKSSCATCRHRNRALIEKDCAEFQKARKSGETAHSWRMFLRAHLKPQHGYSHQWRTLKRHMEECLDQELT